MQAVLYAMAAVMAVAAIVAQLGLRPGIHIAADAGAEATAEVQADALGHADLGGLRPFRDMLALRPPRLRATISA